MVLGGYCAVGREVVAGLSVGLAPGVTNLLAREAGGGDVEIGVLIGAGDRHGPSAVDWTLDSLASLGESWRMRFPAPYGVRTVHRFPFSDQYTLPGASARGSASTRAP
ncbi:hypothetical protein GCM10010402_67660 [Actinomadura luteofluorescens]|nr:hypothetical protein [Actinomadura glauciflava]